MPAATPFNPSPTLAEAILAHFANPTLSLPQNAAANNTPPQPLPLRNAPPQSAQRLEAIHHIAAVRTRLVASTLLAPALGTLSTVLDHTRAQINEDAKAPPEKQRTPEQRHRTLETARRAAGRILSPANFNPIPPATRPPPEHPPPPPKPPRRGAGRILPLPNFTPTPLFPPPRSPPAIQNPGGHAGATRATQQQPIPVPHSPPKEPLASA
nr:hypothetical protein [Phycisphaerales bacterium]